MERPTWRTALYRKLLDLTPEDFVPQGSRVDVAEIEVPISWDEGLMLLRYQATINRYGLVPGNGPRQLRLDNLQVQRGSEGTAYFTVLARGEFNDLFPVYEEVDFAALA